jgi:hypothetical protein
MLSGVQRLLTLSEQQPALIAHYSVNTLVVDLATVDLQPCPDAPIAVSSSVFDNAGNGILEFYVVGSWW